MLTLLAILLAMTVIPTPWGACAVGVAALVDLAETVVLIRRTGRAPSPVGAAGMIGRKGIATTRLSPEGRVRIFGELWAARVESGSLACGASVEVERVEGLELVVRASIA
jgi:membrane protein implicated in regulation of membrane protease activity